MKFHDMKEPIKNIAEAQGPESESEVNEDDEDEDDEDGHGEFEMGVSGSEFIIDEDVDLNALELRDILSDNPSTTDSSLSNDNTSHPAEAAAASDTSDIPDFDF
ncbi:hypothetical protein QCA50_018104 [Cerrena zonata]|uniref:Uncharacterized protein n=1 Tax=Cerrena zonata TaxID=2478898 RepID=A0AAW0FJ28_9APHY